MKPEIAHRPPTVLHFEHGHAYLHKQREELCGDSAAFTRLPEFALCVLSDGLGSGVKANILSTLTVTIISRMLEKGLPLDDVLDTLAKTLPVCKVRKLAYSTFAVAQLFRDGTAYLAEYDSPETFCFRRRSPHPVPYIERRIGDRTIREATLKVKPGDWLVMVSDGELYAGVGGRWNLGWGWDRIRSYLKERTNEQTSAQEVADDMIHVAHHLYAGSPGDDASVIAIKVRERRFATVLTGPPVNRRRDKEVVAQLMSAPGKKIVCGGTTGNIVARQLGAEPRVELETMREDVPPIAALPGLDLVSEGVLTLTKVLRNLEQGVTAAELRWRGDGASALTRLLLEADEVVFLVGQAINPAHQNPEMPADLGFKHHAAAAIARAARGTQQDRNHALFLRRLRTTWPRRQPPSMTRSRRSGASPACTRSWSNTGRSEGT